VRRTQFYLDGVSDLVRKAVRERYLGKSAERKAARLGISGLWKDRTDLPDTGTYVRELRKGRRMERLGVKR
jgi:hypothetical protein